jgi:uncharacterized protein
MFVRQAVLLTASKSSCPFASLSCKPPARVSRLESAHPRPLGSAENKGLTQELSPLESALTKTPGVGGIPGLSLTRLRDEAVRSLEPTSPAQSYSTLELLVTNHQSLSVVSFLPVNNRLNELSDIECRVLGSLIEKEATTPEYYPLSLNALVNACNQKSNRDPVMILDESAVRQALHTLDGQSLVRSVSASDSRVTKYEHRLQETFNFYRHEIAILCVLLLRGPQTPGELRTRTERMHTFDDLSAVQSSLQHLMKREPPLVKVLPRQPGTKEARYTHLLSGDIDEVDGKPIPEARPSLAAAGGEQLAHLENEVAALRRELADSQKEIAELKQQFSQFREQFE